jgi:peptide chain release factor 2
VPSAISPAASASSGGIFDFDSKKTRLAEVARELEDPNIWNDAKRAQDLGKEKKSLDDTVGNLISLSQSHQDADELLELAAGEGDDATLIAVETDLSHIRGVVEKMEFQRMFADPLDPNSCFLDLQSGSGGTEAQDWTQMLLRMYLRYADRKGFQVDILEQSDGDVAGIKGATIKVTGEYAYGHLRTETGIHRLVRTPGGIRRFRASSSIRKSMTPSRSTSILPICESTPTEPRALGASM